MILLFQLFGLHQQNETPMSGPNVESSYVEHTGSDSTYILESTAPPPYTKSLYLTDPGTGLDRIDPVASGDNTTSTSEIMGMSNPDRIFALRGDGKQDFYEYDIATDLWSGRANVPTGIQDGGALAFDGTYIYAIDGKNSNPTRLYRYNLDTDSWTTMASLPTQLDAGADLIHANSNCMHLKVAMLLDSISMTLQPIFGQLWLVFPKKSKLEVPWHTMD